MGLLHCLLLFFLLNLLPNLPEDSLQKDNLRKLIVVSEQQVRVQLPSKESTRTCWCQPQKHLDWKTWTFTEILSWGFTDWIPQQCEVAKPYTGLSCYIKQGSVLTFLKISLFILVGKATSCAERSLPFPKNFRAMVLETDSLLPFPWTEISGPCGEGRVSPIWSGSPLVWLILQELMPSFFIAGLSVQHLKDDH